MMMKSKKMKVSMDPAPSSSFLTGEGSSAWRKHQILFQDYRDLLKDTEEKRERLNRAFHIKLKLLAEVKFLSQKYHSFSRIPQAKPSRAKKPSSRQVAQPSLPLIETSLKERNRKSKKVSVQSSPRVEDFSQLKVPLKGRNQKSKEVSVQSAPMLLDLNQVSLPNGEETAEFEVKWEPLRTSNSKRSFIEGNALTDDIKLSICRDIGSSSGPPGWGTTNFHGKISSL